MKTYSIFLFFASFILTASVLFGLYATPPTQNNGDLITIIDESKITMHQ